MHEKTHRCETFLLWYFWKIVRNIPSHLEVYERTHTSVNPQTALHNVLDNWYYNIADGLLTSVSSFDIKKCFDTIIHSILFKKMAKYGFGSDAVARLVPVVLIKQTTARVLIVIMNYL